MNERVYCSELAQQGGEPLHGTAVQVDQWLLVEYARPWKAKALTDNEFPAALTAHLNALPDAVARLSGRKLRVQFIKQAASGDVAQPRVMLASATEEGATLLQGRLAEYAELTELGAQQIVGGELPDACELHEEIYLVCTNGQRDLCCARFGLPVYEALRAELGGRVWQTTHIGGHRYAPNVVCLPSGFVYGFVAPDSVLDLARQNDAGRLVLDQLRGRSCLAEPAQAAECFLRRALADEAAFSLRLADVETVGQRSSVSFTVDGARQFSVVVAHRASEPVLASCGAQPKAIERYELIEII